MDLRTTLGISIIILAFTVYYLEKEIGKKGVFWGYAALGLVFGAASVVQVAHHSPSRTYYIIFATIFTLIAILYYEEEGIEEAVAPAPVKKEKKRKKSSRAEAQSYRELLKDLEDSFRKGRISKDVYKRQRSEYERKLRELG